MLSLQGLWAEACLAHFESARLEPPLCFHLLQQQLFREPISAFAAVCIVQQQRLPKDSSDRSRFRTERGVNGSDVMAQRREAQPGGAARALEVGARGACWRSTGTG